MSTWIRIRQSKSCAFCTISRYPATSTRGSSCRIQLDRIRRRQFSDTAGSSPRTAPPPPPVPENAEGPKGGGSSSSHEKQKQKSAHAQWYADTVPAMVPVMLLGSAVYFALLLTQQNLSSEKYLDEANARIQALEAEILTLRENQLQARTSASSGARLSALAPADTVGDTKPSRWRLWW